MKTLIKNATVVLPGAAVQTNVVIEDTKIVDIDPAIQLRVDETIDAAGLHLLPGVIDDQVHFREPGLTHKEDLRAASQACAKGGVTTYLEMPNTVPTTTSVERLQRKGGREVMARCPSREDAQHAADWLVDRVSRLAPDLAVEADVESGGGQYLVVLRTA